MENENFIPSAKLPRSAKSLQERCGITKKKD